MKWNRPQLLLPAALLLTASLAACNTDTPVPSAITPSVPSSAAASGERRAHTLALNAGSPNVHTVEFDVASRVTTHVPNKVDLVSDLPTGIHAAYRFSGSAVKARVNLPGSAFPDNRARIAVLRADAGNSASSTGGVVFADTLQADPGISGNDVAQMMQGLGGEPSNTASPFTVQNAAAFAQQSQGAGAGTGTAARAPGESGPDYTTAQRSVSTNNGQNTVTSTLYFDPQVGAVTKQKSTLVSPDMTAQNTTAISYITPNDQPSLRIPSSIAGQQTVTSKTSGEAQISMDVQTNFNNPQVNTLADSYFDVGGL